MDATTLATEFYRNGLGNTWLSKNRSIFLRNLAIQDHEREVNRWRRTREGAEPPPMYSNHVWGDLELEPGKTGTWSMRLSPVNGCGFFSVTTHDLAKLAVDSRAGIVNAAVNLATQRFERDDMTREDWINLANFLRWAPGYLSAAHEHEAWDTYDEAVEMVMAAWEREHSRRPATTDSQPQPAA